MALVEHLYASRLATAASSNEPAASALSLMPTGAVDGEWAKHVLLAAASATAVDGEITGSFEVIETAKNEEF